MHRLDGYWEETFQAAFQHSPHGIAIVSDVGQWVYFNDFLCSMLGYSEKELKEKTFQDITHPEDLRSDLDLYEQVLEGKIRDYSIAKRYIKKDASELWCLLSVVGVFDENDKFLYFVSQIRDNHEQLMQEQQLFNTAEETRKFLKILSHDMREPLREINYELHKIKNMYHDVGPYIENSVKNIERLLGRVSNILEDLSIYSNVSMLKEKDKAIKPLVFTDFLSNYFPKIIQEFNKVISIRVEENDLFNLINQLYLNSVKFRHQDRMTKVKISCFDYAGEWILCYEDNGIGIDEKFWEKVFEPLFQVEKFLHEGNGIGLSICKKICKKYYGDIIISESSHEGTRFKIRLKK
ncbi:MAG: PAS domain S-box protein [Flavobacteriales bacterium]|nr:PAS domain S-box protein [Flavobacteriales bacterium]